MAMLSIALSIASVRGGALGRLEAATASKRLLLMLLKQHHLVVSGWLLAQAHSVLLALFWMHPPLEMRTDHTEPGDCNTVYVCEGRLSHTHTDSGAVAESPE